MKDFVFIGAVLSSCCWISVSVSQTVSVQPGDDATLLCNKHPGAPMFWFRLVNRTRISCISVSLSTGSTGYCDGFKSGSFHTSSNKTTSVLRIKQLNVSDSGLYFCGFATKERRLFTATQLHVNGTETFYDDTEVQQSAADNTKLITVTLRFLNVLLVTIILVLVVKVIRLLKGDDLDASTPD